MALHEKNIFKLETPSRLFTQKRMNEFIKSLLTSYRVYGPISRRKQTVFGEISGPEDIVWDYETTTLPPKKYLHQPFETLFSFKDGGNIIEEVHTAEKQVLFGLHPCDVNAIQILDRVFTGRYEDPYYIERRKNTFIVALSCSSAQDTCYCNSFDTGPYLNQGFDLLITQLGNRFLVEIGSRKGENLLKEYDGEEILDDSLLEEYHRLKLAKLETIENKIEKKIDTADLSRLLEVNIDHPVWKELKEECLACGSCTIVCPTCFCFEVVDRVDLTLKSGERQRIWDSCMLLEFAEVALGVNFREERAARIKQRIYQKLYSFEHQYDVPGCVGCGRCIRFCIKKIDPRQIIEDIRGEQSDTRGQSLQTAQG